MFYFVYRVILNVQVPNYLSFIVSGILPWVFFSSTVTESMDSLVSNQHLLSHAPVPIQVFLAASTYANFINYLPSLPLIWLIVWLDSSSVLNFKSLLILPLSVELLLFTYAISFLLACLYVFLRDLKHLVGLIMQIWLYVTPILYTSAMVPEKFRWVTWLNPLSGFFITFRQAVFNQETIDIRAVGLLSLWTIALVVAAEWMRRRVGVRIVERI